MPLTRLLLPPTLLVCTVLALLVGVVRARPYSDAALRPLLYPDCETPCLLGIVHGETAVRTAIRQLSHTERVVSAQVGGTSGGASFAEGQIRLANVGSSPQMLSFAVVETDLRFGDVWLAVRDDPRAAVRYRTFGNLSIADGYLSLEGYLDEAVLIALPGDCATFWHEPVTLRLDRTVPLVTPPVARVDAARRQLCDAVR